MTMAAGIVATIFSLGNATSFFPVLVFFGTVGVATVFLAYMAALECRNPNRQYLKKMANSGYITLVSAQWIVVLFVVAILAGYRRNHPEWLDGWLTAGVMVAFFVSPVVLIIGLVSSNRKESQEVRSAVRSMGVLVAMIALLWVVLFFAAFVRLNLW